METANEEGLSGALSPDVKLNLRRNRVIIHEGRLTSHRR
jgi:hypothetical protein